LQTMTKLKKIKTKTTAVEDAKSGDLSISPVRTAGRDAYKYVTIVLLIILGLVYSLYFLQHFVFPNSDFTSFVQTGNKWLSLEIPRSMKRAPVFSIISALIGKAFGAPVGSLFGTGLYNALMLPLAMVLIYLLSRELLGKAAMWVAFLAGISPYMIRMSSQPLAEMTFVVLISATALAASKNSRWAYLFAMLSSLARWDLAALIPAVALTDLIRNRKWRRPIVLGALTSIPFCLCMVITYFQLRGQTSGAHYLQVFAKDAGFELSADLEMYRQNICSFLAAPLIHSTAAGPANSAGLNSFISGSSGFLLAAAVIAGAALSIVKKRWSLIVLLLAGVPYVIVHAAYPYRLGRFCVPFGWAGLVISAYASVALWRWFIGKPKPAFIVPMLQIGATVIFVLWSLKLFSSLEVSNKYCPVIMKVAIIAAAVAVAGFVVLELTRRSKVGLTWLVVPAFLVLSVFSSATSTGFVMGNGQQGANFKVLAQWFEANAKEDDRMVSTMPSYIALYSNLPEGRFVHIGSIKTEEAKDFTEFVQQCRKRNITLIAWDSRLYNARSDRYYKLWGLDRWDPLAAPFLGKKVTRIDSCQLVYVIPKGSPLIAVWRILPQGD
jgi:hypothetical protein